MAKAYRPSNGSEGSWFESKFCSECVRNSRENPCGIWLRAMAYGIDDPKYPKQLVRDDEGAPSCTSFADHYEPRPKPRCKQTKDLFA